mmetsp:Transcript_4380/g.7015  ORF Transcript_4380/g.7015 Transcript_4380/m.7015 type:complete len:90 (-) Transcript_4380:1090-1359(-)
MIFSLQEMFVRRSDCRTTCTVHRSSVDEFCPGRKMSAKQQASQALGARGQRSTPLRNTKHLVEIVPPGIDVIPKLLCTFRSPLHHYTHN